MIVPISNTERQQKIYQIIEEQGRIAISEICEVFGISEPTARRDLDSLEHDGKIQRVHGGALLIRKAAPEEPILRRSTEQENEKERIGRACAALINNGDTVFLGTGTTVLQVARNLIGRPLTVITNSLPIINLFADCPEINLIALGGIFRSSERSFIGHITEQALRDLRADKVIIGIHAISLEHGLTNDYLSETVTDRTIIQMGQKVMIVADHTKFGRISTVYVTQVEKVHTIITDNQVDPTLIDLLKAKNVEMVVV
jgi:DeoR/GlpR family transcriptional regulator of sugar metabolism